MSLLLTEMMDKTMKKTVIFFEKFKKGYDKDKEKNITVVT